jgi:5'-nucleotidase
MNEANETEFQKTGLGRSPLRIHHFNDVYELENRTIDPCGGPSRFAHLRKCLGMESLLLFSGDALYPSVLSTFTKGQQMIDVMNAMGVDAACVGNHDFDGGLETFIEKSAKSHFPWICSNAKVMKSGLPLGNVNEFVVLEKYGWKVGIVAIIEEEWLSTLAIDVDDILFEPPIECANRLSSLLRREHCVDFVIALTHMRTHNDLSFASSLAPIDLILGGHDHTLQEIGLSSSFHQENVNRVIPTIKSGCEFRYLTEILVSDDPIVNTDSNNSIGYGRGFGSTFFTCRRFSINKNMEEDGGIKEIIRTYLESLKQELEKKIGFTKSPLEARFDRVRTQETNVGNLITDVTRFFTNSEVVLINSGSCRADSVVGPGSLKLLDLVTLLPMMDSLVTMEVPGYILLQALENGVSKYPILEGRFPFLSGVRFEFDSTKPPGERILMESVLVVKNFFDVPIQSPKVRLSRSISNTESSSVYLISPSKRLSTATVDSPSMQNSSKQKRGWFPLDMTYRYKLVTKSYLFHGKDGYSMFCDKSVGVLVGEESGPILPDVIRKYFHELEAMEVQSPSLLSKILGLDSDEAKYHGGLRLASEDIGIPDAVGAGSFAHRFIVDPVTDGRIRLKV